MLSKEFKEWQTISLILLIQILTGGSKSSLPKRYKLGELFLLAHYSCFMSSDTSHNFRLNLLENGIDFILRGIDELFDNKHHLYEYQSATTRSPDSYKYGCLHLFAGFLLILKERLARHVPELIYKGSLAEARAKLEQGKFPNTVDFDELLRRLEIGPRVTFSNSELTVLRKMQEFRNTFEHAEVSLNKHEIWAHLSRFLDIVDAFLTKELNVKLEESTGGETLSNKIKKIDHAWERIQNDMRHAAQRNLRAKLEKLRERKEEILNEIEDERWDTSSPGFDLLVCSDCGEESLLNHGEFAGICIGCEEITCLTKCVRCGDVTPGFDWEQELCVSCTAYIASQ